jgi:hypothetical protein
VLMPIVSAIVIYFTFEPFIALLAVTLVGGVVVAVFYIIVGKYMIYVDVSGTYLDSILQ